MTSAKDHLHIIVPQRAANREVGGDAAVNAIENENRLPLLCFGGVHCSGSGAASRYPSRSESPRARDAGRVVRRASRRFLSPLRRFIEPLFKSRACNCRFQCRILSTYEIVAGVEVLAGICYPHRAEIDRDRLLLCEASSKRLHSRQAPGRLTATMQQPEPGSSSPASAPRAWSAGSPRARRS
jgi:hypothetical protein